MYTGFTVDNRIVKEADNMAKELHLPFRDCLEVLVKADMAETAQTANLPEIYCASV